MTANQLTVLIVVIMILVLLLIKRKEWFPKLSFSNLLPKRGKERMAQNTSTSAKDPWHQKLRKTKLGKWIENEWVALSIIPVINIIGMIASPDWWWTNILGDLQMFLLQLVLIVLIMLIPKGNNEWHNRYGMVMCAVVLIAMAALFISHHINWGADSGTLSASTKTTFANTIPPTPPHVPVWRDIVAPHGKDTDGKDKWSQVVYITRHTEWTAKGPVSVCVGDDCTNPKNVHATGRSLDLGTGDTIRFRPEIEEDIIVHILQ